MRVACPPKPNCTSTPKGFEPLRAEPNGFLVHLLSHSDTVSSAGTCSPYLSSHRKAHTFLFTLKTRPKLNASKWQFPASKASFNWISRAKLLVPWNSKREFKPRPRGREAARPRGREAVRPRSVVERPVAL